MSVDLIMGLGDDQMQSQFLLIFPTGIPGGGDANAVSLRMMESIDPPEEAVGEYEIKFQGLTILKTSMNDGTDKHIGPITVRMDSQWKVFDDMMRWKRNVHDPVKGIALPESATRTTLVIQALDGQKNVKKNLTFKHVKLQKLKVTEFSHSSEDPTKIELNFIYGYMDIA